MTAPDLPEPGTASPLPDGDCARRLGRPPAEDVGASFALVLSCIDGRIQLPLQAWARGSLNVDYADVVTEPGIDLVLAHGSATAREGILDKACVSRLAHHSACLILAGHADCAANPVDRAQHEVQIAGAVAYLRSALPRVAVIGVFLDEAWTPEVVCPLP